MGKTRPKASPLGRWCYIKDNEEEDTAQFLPRFASKHLLAYPLPLFFRLSKARLHSQKASQPKKKMCWNLFFLHSFTRKSRAATIHHLLPSWHRKDLAGNLPSLTLYQITCAQAGSGAKIIQQIKEVSNTSSQLPISGLSGKKQSPRWSVRIGWKAYWQRSLTLDKLIWFIESKFQLI